MERYSRQISSPHTQASLPHNYEPLSPLSPVSGTCAWLPDFPLLLLLTSLLPKALLQPRFCAPSLLIRHSSTVTCALLLLELRLLLPLLLMSPLPCCGAISLPLSINSTITFYRASLSHHLRHIGGRGREGEVWSGRRAWSGRKCAEDTLHRGVGVSTHDDSNMGRSHIVVYLIKSSRS